MKSNILKDVYWRRIFVNGYYIIFLLIANVCFSQSAGFNNTFAILSLNGGVNTYYDLKATTSNADFNGLNLGTFNSATNSLILKGAEHNIWKCGGCDLTSTRLNYRIYSTSSSGGAFSQMNVPYSSGFNNGCSGQDQVWSVTNNSVNLLNGLSSGVYYLEVYSDASVTCSGGAIYASNSAANYKATFTVVCTDAGITSATALSSTICSSATTTLTANGVVGTNAVTTWYTASGGGGSNLGSGLSINVGVGTYYARVTAACGPPAEASVTVSAYSASVGGTVGGSTSICSGSTSGVLTLSGNTGSVVRWESAVSPFTNWTTISNTATTYTSGVLTETTKFRAVVNNSSCGEATASPATITVNPSLPASVSISASPSGAICIGTSITFTATPTNGGSAPTYQWKVNCI